MFPRGVPSPLGGLNLGQMGNPMGMQPMPMLQPDLRLGGGMGMPGAGMTVPGMQNPGLMPGAQMAMMGRPQMGMPGQGLLGQPQQAFPQNNKMNKIWIKHLPQSATIVQLGVYFSSFGKVIDCEIIKDPQGRNTGVGYVCYDSEETAQREVVKQHMFQGQKLVLEPAYKFEMRPEFNDILMGKMVFPPLTKAAYPTEDDFEQNVNNAAKARRVVDGQGQLLAAQRDAGPPMFAGQQGVPMGLPPSPMLGPAVDRGVRMVREGSPMRRDGEMGLRGDPREQMMRGAREEMMLQPRSAEMVRMEPIRGVQESMGRDPRELQMVREAPQSMELAMRAREMEGQMRGPAAMGMPMGATPQMVAPSQVAMATAPSSSPAIPMAPQPGTVPIRAQAVSSSALYGRVNLRPAPELTLHGDNLKSVYVSGFSWWTTDEDVRNMVVEIIGSSIPFNIIFDEHKPNGKSLGSVFIDVQTEQIAQLIIKGLHGKVVNRKELKAELFTQSSDSAGTDQGTPRQGDAPRLPAPPGTANATPVSEKRKPLEDGDPDTKKRQKVEPQEICKWHLEGGCKYGSACLLLHPDPASVKGDLKDKSASRSEKKGKDDEKRRTHRSSKDEKKSSRKDEKDKKHTTSGSGSTRHRHRHESAEDGSGSEGTDAKAKRRK